MPALITIPVCQYSAYFFFLKILGEGGREPAVPPCVLTNQVHPTPLPPPRAQGEGYTGKEKGTGDGPE